MLKRTYKNLLIAILLLAYVGQGLAAATMPCKHMASDTAHLEQLVKSDHCSTHSNHPANAGDNSTNPPDCCTHCNCFLGGCSTIALPAALQPVALLSLSVFVDGYVDSSLSKVAIALFRPPIVR